MKREQLRVEATFCDEAVAWNWVQAWAEVVEAFSLLFSSNVAVKATVHPGSLVSALTEAQRASGQLPHVLHEGALCQHAKPWDVNVGADVVFAFMLLELLDVACKQSTLPDHTPSTDAFTGCARLNPVGFVG